MKWIFLLGLLMITPVMAVFLRHNPKHLRLAGFAIGILPFLLSGLNLTASPIAWPYWPGTVKGMDISLLDGVALAVIAATGRASTPLPIKLALSVYVLAMIVSTVAAPIKEPAIFYAWQVLRTILVYVAVLRACATVSGFPVSVLAGMVAGIVMQAGIAASEYAGGAVQAGAWFGHQNLLGMAAHFGVYPAFALLLSAYRPKMGLLAFAAGLLIAFTGGSRATIGLLAAGLGLTLVLSAWHHFSGRKAAFGIAAILVLLAAGPVLYSAVQRRSDDMRASSSFERNNMNNAARMIIADHPLGVGANRYVIVANVEGYSERAGVNWFEGNRSSPVHNSYLLVNAELGWLGLFGLIALFATIIATGFRAILRAAPSEDSELLVGVTASLIVLSAHMYFEWVTMYFHIHYLIAINTGLLVGLRARVVADRRERQVTGPSAFSRPAKELSPSV